MTHVVIGMVLERRGFGRRSDGFSLKDEQVVVN
jgi:hypothetical protein